ncbi:MAG: response regulator transcription factor [Xanthomonadales bacterium]|nr:response regulator transcription factor [Xanthomonadales bacterium]
MRALIVEDDPDLLHSLARLLREQGFAVDTAADGQEGLYLATEFPIDVAIIDLGLPRMSGLELIKRLRAAGRKFPVLVLTARSDWQDKVAGLETGADDYLTKPFHQPELLARLNALLRRSAGHAQPLVRMGPVLMDLTSQRVLLNEQELDLTSYEYKVLQYLFMHPDAVVTKTELSEHLYEEDTERDSNVIEVFVGRLRRKLDPDGTLNPIETLRGRGYRLSLLPGLFPAETR